MASHKLEVQGKKIGKIGYGMLGLTWRNSKTTEEEAFEVLRTSLEKGCNMWNGGEFYGTPENNSLTLLNKYYEKYPEDVDKVVLNIKGATRFPQLEPDGSAEFVRSSVENCLKMLGPRGKIDQFECARKDPKVPLTETLGVLKEFVDAGKIGGIALSEVNASSIREAAAITKIVGVEIELSLWHTEPLTNGICDACAELGIPIIAYSPVAKGMLTGQIKSLDDIPQDDFRRMLPRFQPDAFEINMQLVREVEKLAAEKGCTPAQLAINWVASLSNKPGMPLIIPIPGASSVGRVKENSTEVDLTDEDLAKLDRIMERFDVIGDRYHAAGMKWVDA